MPTIRIQIPISEKLACILNVCGGCLAKFTVADKLSIRNDNNPDSK
jgi:hypothetical protein